MNHSWQGVHKSFTLNGVSYIKEDLQEVGYSLVKEGLDFEQPIGEFLLDWCSTKNTLEVQTSGSTGKPKHITLQKSHMLNSALATGKHFGLKSGDSALLCLPTSSIAGKMMLVRAMVLGLHLEYVEPSSNPLNDTFKSYSFSAMVPLQVEKSMEQLHRVQKLIVGGAPISMELERKLIGVGTSIYATYGMTETITHVAVRQISPKHEDQFKTLPFISIAKDKRGCLTLEAPKISEVPVITNDLVDIISDSSFIWLGRVDNIINSGGVKLIPEQIEAKLSSMLKTRFFVTAIPDKTLGEQLVLVLEGKDMHPNSVLKDIKATKDLNKFEIPKKVISIDSFVETKTGKINRIKTLEAILG